MPPKVTVITATYNCCHFIGQTIRSVLEQGYDNLKYVVIDDASTDGTGGLLGQMNDLVVPITHSHNLGEQVTVNEGLKEVEGNYFMIVNADDPLLPGAIPALVDFMEAHPDILVGYPDWQSINENGDFHYHVKSREYDFSYMVRHHTCLPSVGSIFRSSVIERVGFRDPAFTWLGDFDYWLRIGLAGDMARVPATLATWRHRTGQASRNKTDTRAREHIGVIDKLYSYPDIPEYLKALEKEARCWSYLVAAAVCGSTISLCSYLTKAITLHPRLLSELEFYESVTKRFAHIFRR